MSFNVIGLLLRRSNSILLFVRDDVRECNLFRLKVVHFIIFVEIWSLFCLQQTSFTHDTVTATCSRRLFLRSFFRSILESYQRKKQKRINSLLFVSRLVQCVCVRSMKLFHVLRVFALYTLKTNCYFKIAAQIYLEMKRNNSLVAFGLLFKLFLRTLQRFDEIENCVCNGSP